MKKEDKAVSIAAIALAGSAIALSLIKWPWCLIVLGTASVLTAFVAVLRQEERSKEVLLFIIFGLAITIGVQLFLGGILAHAIDWD